MKITIRRNPYYWALRIDNDWNSDLDLFRCITIYVGPVYVVITR